MSIDEEIVKLYNELGNGGLIAKQLGITNYKVYQALRKNNIEPKKIGGKQKASVEDIKFLYESGLSATEVASRLGMKAPSVIERLQTSVLVLSEIEHKKLHKKVKDTD